MDPVLKNILHDYDIALKTYERQGTWARWLDRRDMEELELVLDHWQWPERQIQKRLLEDHLSLRLQAIKHFTKVMENLTNLECIFSRLRDYPLRLSETATRARQVFQQTNGLVHPTLTQTSQVQEGQPVDFPGDPIWWQQHKNQLFVGLIVGLPGLIVGILALIFG